MDTLGRGLAILLAILLVAIYPMQYLTQNQKTVLDNHVQFETKKFADDILLKSYISKDMYTGYMDRLDTTSQLYDVEITHSEAKEGFDTGSNNTDNSNVAYNNDSDIYDIETVHSKAAENVNTGNYSTDIDKDTKIARTTSNKKKNISDLIMALSHTKENTAIYTGYTAPQTLEQLLSYNKTDETDCEITSFSTHTHTDACYPTCTGIDYNGDGKINTDDCEQFSSSVGPFSTATSYVCRKCGKEILYTVRTPAGISSYKESPHGKDTSHPVCDRVAVSITPTVPLQIIRPGQSIVSTAIVTYLDGHTGEVNCNYNFISNTVGIYDVTLVYSGLVDNGVTTGQKTCTTKVTVLGDRISDPLSTHIHTDACYGICTGWDWNNNGTVDYDDYAHVHWYEDGNVILHVDVTCMKCGAVIEKTVYNGKGDIISHQFFPHNRSTVNIVCDKVVTSITPTIPNQTIKPGQSIVSTAIATYLDGHTGEVNCQYNFYSTQTGTFDVTLTYKGLVDNGMTTGQKTCTTKVNVGANKTPISLTVTPSSYSVYNGNEPTYTVRVNYDDNTSKVITEWYTKEGFTQGAGTKTVTFSYYENNKIVSTSITIVVKRNLKTCIHGHTYELDDFDNDPGCPICKTVLAYITPTKPSQTIKQGQSIDSTATATYLDGHTEVVNCGYNFNSNTVGTYDVTLSYTGLVDNGVIGQKTCTTKVTVTWKRVPNSLTVTPSSYSVYNGNEPFYTVRVNYDDNTSKVLTGGYSKSGFTNGAGTKTVTFSYTESNKTVSASVTIVVKRNLKTCIYGHTYELDDFDNDPGCPICKTVLVYITPTKPNQTIKQGQSIDNTATATYQDGHTEVVNCGFNFNSDTVGIFDVTLLYTGLINNGATTGQKSCTTKVTVTWKRIPTSLTITPSSYSVYNGNEPSYTVRVNYDDNTSKVLTGGYSKSGFTKGAGTKTVTFSYTESNKTVSASVTIEVKRNVKTCVYGHTYELDDFDNDPGCPICKKVIISITPTKPSQTIKRGQSIDSTATATYQDGHTEVVNCGYNFTSDQPGIFDVTLYYSGLIDNGTTTGQKTCTTRVTVLGFPISLTVTPSSYSVYNGNEPTYTVKVNYEDDTSKVITGGYIKDGFTEGAGTKTVTFTYTENSKTVSTSITIVVKRNLKTCINGHTYELDDFDNDLGCPICKTALKSISVSPSDITIMRGNPLNVSVTATYMDNHTELITSGWSSNLDKGKLGKQDVTVYYKGMEAHVNVTVTQSITCPICGTIYPAKEDGSDPGCPVCKSKVVSISATPDTQTVNIKENMKVEVTATYQDGHKAIVTDWSSDFNSFKAGKQQVTISYQSKSTTVTVFVQSETETTCPTCGNIYNPIVYPNGCPKCAETVTGIEARLKNGGTLVQYGSDLSLYVILIYKDNHRVITYDNWSVEGYQPTKLGKQIITVKYKEFSTTLEIEVVNTLIKKVCPNGHVYYLNEDGSDPGCPYCNEDPTTDSSKGYIDNIYSKDILKEIYDKGIYYLNKGDYITITVRQKNESIFMKLQSMLHFTPEAETKKYIYGGMVG